MMWKGKNSLPTGFRTEQHQISGLVRDWTLCMLGVGYIAGALFFALAVLLAGCSSKGNTDVDVGLRANVRTASPSSAPVEQVSPEAEKP